MSQIVDELRAVATQIETETQVGGNTAARVGGAFNKVADCLDGTQQIADLDAAVAAVQAQAQASEQTIQNLVNNLAVTQTMGQSTSSVMSQKAVTDVFDTILPIVTNTNKTFTQTGGFINTSGAITSSSAGYKYSSLIAVNEGETYSVKVFTSASTLAIAAYTSDNTTTAVVAKSVIGVGGLATYNYVVPEGIAYVRITNQNTNFANPTITRIAPLTHILDTYDDTLEDVSIIKSKTIDFQVSLHIVNGQFVQKSNGAVASNSNYQYGEFSVREGEKYRITNASTTNAYGIAAYEAGATIASATYSVVGNASLRTTDYVVPAGIVKIRVSHNKGSYPNALAVSSISTFTAIEEEIAVERARVTTNTSDIDTIETYMYDGDNLYTNGGTGYVQANGTILNNTTSPYHYSALIPVTSGDTYEFYTYSTTSILAIAAYTSDNTTTADVTKSVIINGTATQRYVVPEGIAYVRLTCRVTTVPDPYIKRIATYNARFDELEDRVGRLEGGGAKSKPISILFIGNSLTQDAVSYLPYLLTELAPEISFKFYIWYNGGYTLSQQYTKISGGNTCEIFSRCEDSIAWINSNNSVTMDYILQNYKFDIVCLQEYFNYKNSYTDADLAPFNNIIDYIRNNYAYPFKVATFFHQPKRDVADSVFALTKQGNALILRKTTAETMNPAGIAIYRAMSTDLDSLGDQGHLSPDGTHAQEGLPCLLQAYVSALWVCDMLSLPHSVINDKVRITSSVYSSINVPGANGSLITGTDAQHATAQDVAVKSWKEGEYITENNLTEYTS